MNEELSYTRAFWIRGLYFGTYELRGKGREICKHNMDVDYWLSRRFAEVVAEFAKRGSQIQDYIDRGEWLEELFVSGDLIASELSLEESRDMRDCWWIGPVPEWVTPEMEAELRS